MFPVDIDGAPKVVLAGREWPVPKLAHAQNKIVVPAIAKLFPKLSGTLLGGGVDLNAVLAVLDEEAYQLLGRIVYAALTRGTPGLGQGEFDQMPVTLIELIAAFPIIVEATGFFAPAGTEGREPPGEPSPSTISTGTS